MPLISRQKRIIQTTDLMISQYLISTNPGREPESRLGQIVSGGELSRIMLALKAILADRDQIETLDL